MNNISVNSFVININTIQDLTINSIGLVKALNGDHAIVWFIGTNKSLRVRLQDLCVIDIDKTGKGYNKKICNICHILKDSNEFDVNQTDAKGFKTTRPSCKKCRLDIDGKKLTTKERKRMDSIKPEKGSIFECPICNKISIVGVTANLVKDHDHITGIGREWICDSCNTGLGRFKDNIDFLSQAINYLKRFK